MLTRLGDKEAVGDTALGLDHAAPMYRAPAHSADALESTRIQPSAHLWPSHRAWRRNGSCFSGSKGAAWVLIVRSAQSGSAVLELYGSVHFED